MGAHIGALAAAMRERRPVDPSGASFCQLGGDSNEDTENLLLCQQRTVRWRIIDTHIGVRLLLGGADA